MIKGLWSKVRLVCGNHSDESKIIMNPHEAAKSAISKALYGSSSGMFYSCPKYYPENRSENEPCCRNHISVKEFEDMIGFIANKVSEYESMGGTFELVGLTWKSRSGVEYTVVKQTDTHIDIKCVNEKALWKK